MATPTDVRRVQRILTIIGQPSLARAATALHIHGAKSLERQLQYLETTAGIKILRKAPGRNGLRPTAAGAEYIRHARVALELITDAEPEPTPTALLGPGHAGAAEQSRQRIRSLPTDSCGPLLSPHRFI